MSKHGASLLTQAPKVFFIAIALAGCASDIMKNYVGQPVE